MTTTNNYGTHEEQKVWLKRIVLILAATAVFSYLHSRGISPVCMALAIVFFQGFFRFLYKIACCLVTLAILVAIISFLIY